MELGHLLDKAEREGNFTKYKKYLFIRVFFDVVILIAILWSFYYTGTYYAAAVEEITATCPCLNLSETNILVLGAWTGEEVKTNYTNGFSPSNDVL